MEWKRNLFASAGWLRDDAERKESVGGSHSGLRCNWMNEMFVVEQEAPGVKKRIIEVVVTGWIRGNAEQRVSVSGSYSGLHPNSMT